MLEVVYISSNIISIGDKAFDKCPSIKYVLYEGTTTTDWNNIGIGSDNGIIRSYSGNPSSENDYNWLALYSVSQPALQIENGPRYWYFNNQTEVFW